MNKDAFFTRVKSVDSHPNADKLDIITVKGYRCIVPRGAFVEGDSVLYIAPDAKLDTSHSWAEPYARYLGRGNRVKTIKLRGEISEGIVVKAEDLFKAVPISVINEDGSFEQGDLGITHWEAPAPSGRSFGTIKVKVPHLPWGLSPTDQTNVQQMDQDMILSRAYQVTKKLDGTSCTLCFGFEGGELVEFHLCSRNIELDPDEDSVYAKATEAIIENVKTSSFASLDGRLVLRGEICGEGINSSKPNKDATGSPHFYLFEACHRDPGGKLVHYNPATLAQLYRICDSVPVVDIIPALLPSHIQYYLNAPAEHGEGVVLWELDANACVTYGKHILTGRSFKIKSKDYDSMLG